MYLLFVLLFAILPFAALTFNRGTDGRRRLHPALAFTATCALGFGLLLAASEVKSAERAREIARFDLNHNGVIDASERTPEAVATLLHEGDNINLMSSPLPAILGTLLWTGVWFTFGSGLTDLFARPSRAKAA